MAPASEISGTAGRPSPRLRDLVDEGTLHEILKRCSPATHEAVFRFRRSGDAALLPDIVAGLAERFVEPDLRPRLARPDDGLRLAEDLGLDSLTMIEIMMIAEDVLGIPVNEDPGRLRTLGDVRRVIEDRLADSRDLPPAKCPLADAT